MLYKKYIIKVYQNEKKSPTTKEIKLINYKA